jgi:hypothetical protein
MFLQRIFAPFKLFFRKPPDHDLNAEASVILQRVRELMELTPATPLEAGNGNSKANFESAMRIAASDTYGQRVYAEDTH